MKRKLLSIIFTVLSLSFSMSSMAGTIGVLNWDGSSNFITSTEDNNTYIQFGLTAGKTYSEINSLLTTSFAGFHIASQLETLNFANQLVAGSDPFSINSRLGYTVTPGQADGKLGDASNSSSKDEVLFQAGDGTFGLLAIRTFRTSYTIDWNDLDTFNSGTTSYYTNDLQDGWLLVKNSPVASVPEPSTTAMLGLGLLGLFGYSRRKSATSNYL